MLINGEELFGTRGLTYKDRRGFELVSGLLLFPPVSVSHQPLSRFSKSNKSEWKESDARKHMQKYTVSVGCEETFQIQGQL